jgi:hypothetical protein
MTLENARLFFMWCSIINYGILILWFAWFAFAHDSMKSLIEWGFRRPVEKLDSMMVLGITLYKMGLLLFNVVPWIALSLIK